jgi:acetyl esterase/lipase
MKIGKLFISIHLFVLQVAAYEPAEVMDLWPGVVPGEVVGEIGEETISPPSFNNGHILRIKNVSHPTLSFFPADSTKAKDTAILVCPGGAYNILAYEHEGLDICKWLNDLGVSAFLLKYRVPRRQNREKYEAPLQDAQRAMSMIRGNAQKWKIDPNKIGVLGFSAGGNLAMMAVSSFAKRTYPDVDSLDHISCHPDFGILIYPAYLVDRNDRSRLLPEINITSQTSPCFFAHTGDDQVPAEGSVLAYLALKKAGVEGNELHVYPFGGHGYGMRKSKHPVSTWPQRAEEWMRASGWMPDMK